MNWLAAGVLAGSTAALALLPLWCLRGSVYLVLTALAAAAYFVLWSSSRRPGADQAPLFQTRLCLGWLVAARKMSVGDSRPADIKRSL